MTTLDFKLYLTFGIILGLVGGIASVIASVLPLSMRWYALFMYRAKLLKRLYTETDGGPGENPLDLTNKAVWSKPFRFDVGAFICMMLTRAATCGMCCTDRCSRRRKAFAKYEQARSRMQKECDFLEIVKQVRVLNMLTGAIFVRR
jgi:hypothetical protein